MTSKAPSYKNFRPSSEKASQALSRSKSSDTKCERILRSTLWRLGFRFRKNVRDLPGKPDIVFPRERLVVFCDGDFWHGRDWDKRRRMLRKGANPAYWVAKIKANIERDHRYTEQLKEQGWAVIRLWELDILADPPLAAARVAREVRRKRLERICSSKR